MKESAAAAAIPPIPPAPAAAESETYRAPKKTHDIKLPIVESLPKYKSRRKSESYLDEEDLKIR
jgi:hypothetical protein